MNNEFRRIPYFRTYAIDRTGKIVNFNSLRELKVSRTGKITLIDDNHNRTTRYVHLLLKEVFKNENIHS
jgi:hypothetical protein